MSYNYSNQQVDLPISYTTKYYGFAQNGKDGYQGVLTVVVIESTMTLSTFELFGDYSAMAYADIPSFWFTIGY